MKSIAIKIAQMFTIFIGLGALCFLLWEPTVEGVNVSKTLFEIYFMDPFILFAYSVSLLFFVGLYNIYIILSSLQKHTFYRYETIHNLQIIRRCAVGILYCAFIGEAVIFMNESDDRAGGVFMGLLVVTGSVFVLFVTTQLLRKISKRLHT
jgi:hypothetical protein